MPDVIDGHRVIKTSRYDSDALVTTVVPQDPKRARQLGVMAMCVRARAGGRGVCVCVFPLPQLTPPAHPWPCPTGAGL